MRDLPNYVPMYEVFAKKAYKRSHIHKIIPHLTWNIIIWDINWAVILQCPAIAN